MIFRFREKQLWFLLSAGLILFYRPLFFGDTFFFRDLHLHFFPQKVRFAELVRSGQIPLWDPYLHGGQPFLADLNNMALYPLNLIYLILPAVVAFNLDIIFHVLFCGAAAYWLARWLKISPSGAMVAGGVFAFCGYTLSLTNLLSRLTAMPYLPLMIVTFLAFLKEGDRRWFFLCAIFGMLQIFAGAPEMTLITFVTLAGWLFVDPSKTDVKRPIVTVMLLALAVAGLAAVQILPTAEMVRQSTRASGANYEEFSAWSMHIKRLPELFIPRFLGYTNKISGSYWGVKLESMGFPFILSVYFGWFVLSLAFMGTLFRGGFARLRIFLAIFASVALILSIGQYLPGFRFLFDHIPFLGVVRYPIKFLAAGVLPVSLLAAIGFDGILAFQKFRRRVATFFWISFLLFAVVTAICYFRPELANKFVQFYFGQFTSTAVKGLTNSVLQTTGILVLVALIYQWWAFRQTQTASVLLVMILLLDLILNGFNVNHFAPHQFLTSPPDLAKMVKKELGGGRFYRAPNPPNVTLKMPANEVMHFNRWHLETLHDYSAATYSIPVVYHEDFDNLAQKELAAIASHVLRIRWNERLRFLTAGGVSLFLAADEIDSPSVERIAIVRNSSSRRFFLYRNKPVTSIATLLNRVSTTSTSAEMFAAMKSERFDPKQNVFLLKEDALAVQPRSDCKRDVKFVESNSNLMILQSRSDCDTYLYLAVPFYKGWETRVDGRVVPSVRANYAFTAVFVGSGVHRIEREYKPGAVRIGAIISFATLLVLLFQTLKLPKKTSTPDV